VTDEQLAAHVASGGRLRALLLELWQRTRMDWGFVTDRLAQTFRKETWVGGHERRFVGETLYGLVRHLRRVDLGLARGRSAARAPRDLERLLGLLVIEKLLPPAAARTAIPELDWDAVAGVDEAIAGERRPVKRLALAHSMPDWLAARFVADWGDDAEALARGLNQRAPMTVRANLLTGTRAQVADALATEHIASHEGQWSDTALILDTRTNLHALTAFKGGMLEVQDEGSQLLADVAAAALPAGKKIVVDYCAGAGGKTLAIAARMANTGRILATDVDGNKLEELRRRARRAGVSIAQAISIDGAAWPPQVDAMRGKADVVLVDAPCSGIGALRRNPEARWRLREDDLDGFATRQRDILAQALRLCAPGGRVVYATCSLLKSENQGVVDAAVAAGQVTAVPLGELIGPARAAQLGDGSALLVTPHRHGTDGFFAQVLTPAG
jgi:16S rRNA (cytosine967-C5)-methyltransferase